MNERPNLHHHYMTRTTLNTSPQLSWRAVSCILFLVVAPSVTRGQSTEPLQHLWEVQPNLGDIWNNNRLAQSVSIDFDNLLSDQSQIRLETARMICVNHDRPGFGDKAKAIERLVSALTRSDESLLNRRTLTSAACLLDDGTHATKLWELSRNDPVSNQEVQKALIRWRSDVALDHWRKVVLNPSSPAVITAIAIEGLGNVGTNEDQKTLNDILESESASIELRSLAAESLGKIQSSGLSALARKYLESNLPGKDMIAAYLLIQHSDDESLQLLLSVHDKGASTAKRIAANCLARESPKVAEELMIAWKSDPDTHFRELAIQVASVSEPSKTLHVASSMLHDDEDRLRNLARLQLLNLASMHREEIDAIIQTELEGNDWKGMEQAIILLAELGDASKCERLLELFDHPQAEVHMHAAWALRDLSQPGPLLDRIREKAFSLTDSLEKGTRTFEKSEIIMLSLMLETFGRHQHEPAFAILEKYIPKNDFKMGNLARCSAIWSIGQIRKNSNDPDLRAKLRERIKDLPPDKPENYLVRFVCILALGEFGFKDSKEIIDQFGGAPPNLLGWASDWAREQIAKSDK